MHFVYLDESGNTGLNLRDKQQPVFVLCALVVEDRCWQMLEKDLVSEATRLLPQFASGGSEIHANDLRRGNGPFEGMSVTDRIAFRTAWFQVALKHELRVVYRSIEKSRLLSWIERVMGPGVALNPHRPAFPLVARVVNEYLGRLKPPSLGILISDENREIVTDVEQAIRLLRVKEGTLRLGQIVEKGFFVDSRKCLPLQLTDMIAMSLRKHAEHKAGFESKSFDLGAYEILEPLIYRGDEAFQDVMDWLTEEEKKKRPGT